ncbi:MAG: response regulator [Planctomycetota bacterium]
MSGSIAPGDGQLTFVIVDDDDAQLTLMDRLLRSAFEPSGQPISVLAYHDPETALTELPVDRDVVIFLDYELTGTTALDWLNDYRRADAGPVILMTASGDEVVAASAFRMGASDYVLKSRLHQDADRLRACAGEALRRFRLERTNRALSRRLKVSNRELESKNASLAELTDTAHRFVDDVAHEFRTRWR